MIQTPKSSTRLNAFIIDSILRWIMVLPFLRPLWGVLEEEEISISLWYVIFIALFWLIYDFVFLALFQATPGKILMSLRVDSKEGKELTWQQAFLRVFATRMTFFLGIGLYATALFSKERRHLFDWFAETKVITEKPVQEEFRKHWVFGTLVILFYLSDGLFYSAALMSNIDWKNFILTF
ncbi:hypothetical protein BDW_06745 [Bdellovibrio bacteriovorus W]|nr:hypothetical protein BDW_06745 [Bdellovibrio bacteriovorus W]